MEKKLMSILSTVVIIMLMVVIGITGVTTAAETNPITTTTATTAETTEPATYKTVVREKPLAKKPTVKVKKKVIKKKKKSIYVKSKKYPVAARIWNYLRKKGYSTKVTAGIMGNIMAECGGQTLYIQPHLYSSGYYGICQWSLEYHPGIAGANLDKQLSLLKRTIKPEFDNFGFCSGYTYKQFKKIKSEKTAAVAFAKTYERCASCTYYIRKINATKAYKYFCKK